jgi:hypothetical protein
MDSTFVDSRAGGKQDLDQLDSVETRREVERAVEVAAAFDDEIDAPTVNTQLVAQRCSKDIRLRNLAQKRPSGPHLDMHQPRLGIEQAPQRRCVSRPERSQCGRYRLRVLACALPRQRFLAEALKQSLPCREAVLACDDQACVAAESGPPDQCSVVQPSQPWHVGA